MDKFIEGVAVSMTLTGFWFISEGQQLGFIISLFSNLVWIYWGHKLNSTGIMFLNTIFIFINLNGLGVLTN
jgi:hypothetical protein